MKNCYITTSIITKTLRGCVIQSAILCQNLRNESFSKFVHVWNQLDELLGKMVLFFNSFYVSAFLALDCPITFPYEVINVQKCLRNSEWTSLCAWATYLQFWVMSTLWATHRFGPLGYVCTCWIIVTNCSYLLASDTTGCHGKNWVAVNALSGFQVCNKEVICFRTMKY